MPDTNEPTPTDDLHVICETLAGSRIVFTNFIYEPEEPCTHRPGEAQAVLDHLSQLDWRMVADISARLRRVYRHGLRLWGDRPDCRLCKCLRTLAGSEPPE